MLVFGMRYLYEGFGLPILEAMYHVAPVISSNFGVMKEVARMQDLFWSS